MSNILKAKQLDYVQVIDTDDESDVRRVIEFCGVPCHGIDQELIYHFGGSPFLFETSTSHQELCDINGSYIIRLENGKFHLMSECMFKQLFECEA